MSFLTTLMGDILDIARRFQYAYIRFGHLSTQQDAFKQQVCRQTAAVSIDALR